MRKYSLPFLSPVIALVGIAVSDCAVASGPQTPAATVAVGVFIGAVCLVAAVLIASVLFAWLGLSDRTQALALPDGSIRALIALILLSAFISVPIYLYNSLNGELKFVDGVPAADKSDFINSLPKGQFAFAVPSGPANAQVFRIYYRDSNTVTTDFAKEILTAMITLVASVSSFYFGAGVAKTARASGGGTQSPSITSVDPDAGATGATVKPLKISGSNLELVNKVSIVSGSKQVQATDVTSNATLIKCSLALPLRLASGKWSVLVGTSDGKSATLDDAFNVNDVVIAVSQPISGIGKLATGNGTHAPSIASVDPMAAASGATVSPFTITGTNLGLVNNVSILCDSSEVKATDIKSDATEIKCSLALPVGITGKWSCVVGTSDGKSAKLDDAFTVN